MGVFKSQVSVTPAEENTVFQINDILLEVPPTHISIRKEDMAWQWKTLRTKTSTKIPSGRGVVQVSVRLVFVPEHFLTMHRLITEFRHSPFCYIENALIRDSIVPDWMNTQAMAFTMTGLNVQNMTGSPGTFIVDLDLRWFNYSPYALNWLYRDEYATKPVGPEGIVKTIATYDPGLQEKETVIDFLPRGTEVLDSYEILSQTKDVVGGFTMNDLLYNHAGTAFDLLPRPTDVMRKAMPVPPHLSNIYKRYINILQQKSLFHNFDVDIAQMIKDQEISGQIGELLANNPSGTREFTVEDDFVGPIDISPEDISEEEVRANFQGSTWKMFTSGHVLNNSELGSYNRVEALHSNALPKSIRDEVWKRCISFSKEIDFFWHQYIITDEDPEIRKAISKRNQKQQEGIAMQYINAAKQLDRIANDITSSGTAGSNYTGAVNTRAIADIGHTSARSIPRSERITYSTNNSIKTKLLELLPSKEESDRLDITSGDGPPYLFSPPVREVSNFSGFGMRQLDDDSPLRPHNGIDIVSSSRELFSPFNGTLTITNICPYNTYDSEIDGINQFTGHHDNEPEPELSNYTRKQHLIRKGLASATGGISVTIVSDDYPGYSVNIHHMEMIGEDGKIGDTQVANFFKDPRDTQRYGGIQVLSTVKVERGQHIGYYGNTGHSSGPHLHLTLRKNGTAYDPLPFLIARDVSEYTDEELEDLGFTEDGLPTPEEPAEPPTPDEATTGTEEGSAGEAEIYGQTEVDPSEPSSVEENSTVDIPQETLDEYQRRELNYVAEGFLPYEDLQDVKNVRKRTVRYRFVSQNNDYLAGIVPEFLNSSTAYIPQEEDPDDDTHVFTLKSTDNLVITNVVGSLSHVVASIPLLGHEFPTHQHLGSIEPSYTIELVTQADSLYRDNLSAEGALLEIMRSTLQKNARQFRPIPDGYALATDHFITRLLGSYEERDVSFLGSGENDTAIDSIKKRTMINRVSTQTVEGHPGLSSIQMTFVETNPYESEQLIVEEQNTENEREELIKEVLHRLYNMNLTAEGRVQQIVEDYAVDVFTEEDDIEAKLKASGLQPSDFGKTSWDEITEVAVFTANNPFTTSMRKSGGDYIDVVEGEGFVEESTIGSEQAWKILEEFRAAAEEGEFSIYGDYHIPIDSSETASSSVPLANSATRAETNFYFDMSDFYTVYPELKPNNGSSIHADQTNLTARHNLLKEIIRSASISLAEPGLGASQEAVAESFYNLPVQQEMMSCFYYWLELYLDSLARGWSFSENSVSDDSTDLVNSVNLEGVDVSAILEKINWNFNAVPLTAENKALIEDKYNVLQEGTTALGVAFAESLEIISTIDPTEAADDSGIDSSQAELLEEFRGKIQELAQLYVHTFVKIEMDKEQIGFLESLLEDMSGWVKSFGEAVIGAGDDPETGTAYSVTSAQIDELLRWFFSPDLLGKCDDDFILTFYKTLKSIGKGMAAFNFIALVIGIIAAVIGFIFTAPAGGEGAVAGVAAGFTIRGFGTRFLSWLATKLAGRAVAGRVAGALATGGGYAGAAASTTSAFVTSTTGVITATGLGAGVGGYEGGAAYIFNSGPEEYSLTEAEENTAAYQFFATGYASPDYPSFINPDTEAQKLVFFRKKLIQIADSIITNPGLLTALGIRTENFVLPSMINEWVGKECYPDLDLPKHPYYIGTNSYAMSPDFYMWNAYEDGSAAIKDEIKREVEKGVSTVVENSYNFMKQMQNSGIKAVKDGGFQVNNAMTNNLPKIVSLHMNPEGSDEQTALSADATYNARESGMAPVTLNGNGSPIWRTYETSVSAFGANPLVENKAWEALKGSQIADSEQVIELSGADSLLAGSKYIEEEDQFAGAISGQTPVVALSNFDGNIDYIDTSTDFSVYDQYFEKVQNIKNMFGSRQGYLGDEVTEENASEIVSSIADTALASLSENVNWYTRGGIEQLVKQSSADIVSQKMTMKRAYPTFKLYFVEEDEQESRWLNLDDFYSFNAVKEFNFYQSRKEASSTATIVLQNIAGTLDGTRRNAIVDLDYFSRKNAGEIEERENVEVLAESRQHVEAKDQPFDALVLRPGMNVQLRVGYSNDPNMLHVLLNGRVVDVQWNMTGDLTEITVQSFGTELTQTIKGIGGNDYSVDWSDKIYYTTHDLLGSLMLDRDLKHFGRWEFGRLTQIGEDKNADLDFYPYEDEGFLGGMPATKWVYELFTEHPWGVGITILGAAAFLIGTRGKGSKLFAAGRTGRVLQRVPFLRRFFSNRLYTTRFFYSVDDVTAAARTVSTHSEASRIWTALGANSTKAIDDALAGLNLTPDVLSATQKLRAAMTGLNGGVRVKQVERLSSPFIGPLQLGATPPIAGVEAALRVEVEAIAQWNSVSRFVNCPRFGAAQLKSWSGIKSNVWALPNVTLGNMFIKPFTNTLTVGAGAITVAAGLDAFEISENTIGSIKEFIKGIKKRTARVNARLKLTPADDNLYPPSPATYMTLRKIKEIEWWDSLKIGMNGLLSATFGLDIRATWKTVSSILNPEDIDPSVFEKRVLPPACQYKIHASTIWQVFEEMTYRHPGWIWGTRPYGTEFRDTMFFGTPSQRYWSRPASNSFVVRMNKLYEYIQRTGETEDTLKKQITEVYGSDIAEKMIEESQTIDFELEEAPIPSSSVPYVPTDSTVISVDLLKDKFRIAIMDEWLKGMEQRFEPFRRYHLITSEADIVSNNIICSEHSVVNAAQVTYKEMNELGQLNTDETKVLQMKASSLIPDHMLNTTTVDANNCLSRKMALRYGQAAMMYGLKEMYKGEISLLGNPRIRPWDVCILADSYNDISGPIEVESVVHMFSHETGFLTEIKPNALVIGNEIATFPMLEALKLYAMAKKDLEANPINIDGGTVNRTGESTPTTSEAQQYFNRRYNEIYNDGATSYVQELNRVIEESRLLGNLGVQPLSGSSFSSYPTAGEAVGGGTAGAALELVAQGPDTAWTVGRGLVASAAAVTVGVAAATGIARIPQLLGATGRVASISGGLMGVAGGTAAGGGLGYAMFPDKESILDSAATFIGSKLLFAKCMELETVMVIPLLKGQRPIVSGMTLKNPSDVFESILGSVTNVIEDTIVGTRNMHESWRDYRSASWMQVDDIVNERNSFFRRWYTEHQIFYNWQEDYRVR